jgi:hypothetical protein
MRRSRRSQAIHCYEKRVHRLFRRRGEGRKRVNPQIDKGNVLERGEQARANVKEHGFSGTGPGNIVAEALLKTPGLPKKERF